MERISNAMCGLHFHKVTDTTRNVIKTRGYYITVPLWPELAAQGHYWFYEEYVLDELPFEPLFQKVLYLKEHSADSALRISYQLKDPELFTSCWADTLKLRQMTPQNLIRLDPSCDSYFVETAPNQFEMFIENFCFVNLSPNARYVKLYQYIDFSKKAAVSEAYNADKVLMTNPREFKLEGASVYDKDLTGKQLDILYQRWREHKKAKAKEEGEITKRAKKGKQRR